MRFESDLRFAAKALIDSIKLGNRQPDGVHRNKPAFEHTGCHHIRA
jgi:hypothetical protein